MPEKNGGNFSDDYKKLFIGGLTYNTTDEMLKEFYAQWGEIVDCIVMRDPNTKRSRGFGFVTYSESTMLDESMAARPHIIDGKTIEPKRAIPRDMSAKPETNMSVKKLYVSGVREEHTDEMFRAHFGEFGNVQEVEIIQDKATGKPRGFAFVTFDDYDAVDKCVLQKSHMIEGKRCDVKKALSKEEMKKAQQQERERSERDHRSRGTGRGGGDGGQWGGGQGGQGWNQGQGQGQWNQGGGGGGGWAAQQQQQQGWNQGGYGGGGGYPQQQGYGGGQQAGWGGGQGGGWGGGAQGGGWGGQAQQWGGQQQGGWPANPQAAGGWSGQPAAGKTEYDSSGPAVGGQATAGWGGGYAGKRF